MSAHFRLAETRVAILGLGLMGGSLALALRGHCAALYGCDPNPDVLAQARLRRLVDQVSSDPAEVLPSADLVILAAPVDHILTILHCLPGWHPGPAVVLDLGSAKVQITAAMQNLPERFDPIGGHPMCGKEKTSLANADGDLYQEKTFALTPLGRTSPQACDLAEQVVAAIGARPLYLDPVTHDRWTAATSHLPYLISCALALATPAETAPMIGTGFRSTTRIAATPAEMMLAVLESNQVNVLEALARFKEQLQILEEQLKSGDFQSLTGQLDQAAARQSYLVTPEASS